MRGMLFNIRIYFFVKGKYIKSRRSNRFSIGYIDMINKYVCITIVLFKFKFVIKTARTKPSICYTIFILSIIFWNNYVRKIRKYSYFDNADLSFLSNQNGRIKIFLFRLIELKKLKLLSRNKISFKRRNEI